VVKFKMKCSHCDKDNIIEVGKYNKKWYKNYFKDNEILDFIEVNDKFQNNINTGGVLMLMNSETFNGKFNCTHCNKRSKVVFHNSQFLNYEFYTIEKCGNTINKDFVIKLFDYLKTKKRSIPKGVDYTKCQKEIFIERLWKRINNNFSKPYLIKYKDRKTIAYLGNVSYHLGWGEELNLKFINLFGEFIDIYVNENKLMNFEYIEVDGSIAEKIINISSEL